VSEPVEHHIEVTRSARYWVLGEGVADPREVWFVLHGYGQLARRFLRRFEALDDGTRRVVAPEALSRFYPSDGTRRHGPGAVVGATWMTREDRAREIEDYVAYLDRLAASVRAELGRAVPCTVLGFSQGVATAARWSVLGAEPPARLALWGDYLPPDLALDAAREAWAATDVVLVRGSDDPALADPALARAEEDALARAALEPGWLRYQGGHDIEADTLAALVARLDALGGSQISMAPPSSSPASAT
jgi:predicted esterase